MTRLTPILPIWLVLSAPASVWGTPVTWDYVESSGATGFVTIDTTHADYLSSGTLAYGGAITDFLFYADGLGSFTRETYTPLDTEIAPLQIFLDGAGSDPTNVLGVLGNLEDDAGLNPTGATSLRFAVGSGNGGLTSYESGGDWLGGGDGTFSVAPAPSYVTWAYSESNGPTGFVTIDTTHPDAQSSGPLTFGNGRAITDFLFDAGGLGSFTSETYTPLDTEIAPLAIYLDGAGSDPTNVLGVLGNLEDDAGLNPTGATSLRFAVGSGNGGLTSYESGGDWLGGGDGTFVVVPEPSSVILLTLGAVGLAAFAGRRRKRLAKQ